MSTDPKPATPSTAKINRDAVALYDMADRQDFVDAGRGRIADFKDHKVLDRDGKVVFDLTQFDWITDDAPAPDTVNPSLWRQSQVIRKGGLYEVVKGLYQVRNNDIGNLTIVEGDDGIVIIDCTTGVESARQGIQMFREHVSDKPVAAVIYTHTHIDHYGGVKGVVDPDDVASGKVPIIAPGLQFDKFAIGENIVAGNVMSRRAAYAFGGLLPHGPRQFTTCGAAIGNGVGFTVSYLSPTDLVTETGTKREIAGIEFEFLYAPDTEAPEEMHIWIPHLKALTCAENANHTLHNIQTLRGARTRDAANFSAFLDETLLRWGDDAEVHYGPHSWPIWENDNIVEFLESQRDTYKYIHDQSLRLANHGYTPLEAAEEIELPDELGRKWFNRGYHGTLHHDVRGVYTKELGMWDGDPVSLHPHTPVDAARRYVDFIGTDALLAEGQRAFDAGDYRWAVEILHKVVFADPDNQQARELQADAYEQMGYQVEGPQWRYIFLTAAQELRTGAADPTLSTVSPDMIQAMPVDLLFAFAAVHLNGTKAATANISIDFHFLDLDETWTAWVKRGVLHARPVPGAAPQLTVTGKKSAIVGVVLQPTTGDELAQSGQITLDGDATVLHTLADLMDTFEPNFNIVTP